MHNLYTIRGAQVRDGNAWAMYIMESVSLYGDAEVLFVSHNWPRWGNDVIVEYLTNSAAIYKFINDQTLMFINQGYTANEIARMIQLPADLEKIWYTRPYYGTLQHNAKAVYQKYMGWYDANPVNLHPLAPTDSARKFYYMGIRIDSVKAQDLNLRINVDVIGDVHYLLTVRSGVLLYQKNARADKADVTISLPWQAVALLASPDALNSEHVRIEGNRDAFSRLYVHMAEFDPNFNIIEP